VSQPLFLPATIQIEKTASSVRLEEEVEGWPAEIHTSAYKELPFLRALETEIELERTDGARGYAVGKMLAFPIGKTKHAAAVERKLVTFPIIVRDRELAPLDVYMHEKRAYPVDEDKIQALLFMPNVYVGPAAPRDFVSSSNLAGQFRPPVDTAGGLHKRAGLLRTVAPTFRKEAVDAFRGRLRTTGPLRHAFATRPYLDDAAQQIFEAPEFDAEKVASASRMSMPPSVVQFRKLGAGRYLMKMANSRAYQPVTHEVDRYAVQQKLSADSYRRLQAEGFVTGSLDAVDQKVPLVKRASVAQRTGIYRTTVGGRETVGVVIPRMISLEGEPQDVALLSAPGVHALQEKIAGVHLRDVTIPPGVESKGRGVYVYQEGPRTVATEPLDLTTRVTTGHGGEKVASWLGVRLFSGRAVRVVPTEGLQKIAHLGGGVYAIPAAFKWLPIEGRQGNALEDVDDASSVEQLKVAASTELLLSDGSVYQLRGLTHDLDAADMEFELCARGLDTDSARGLMKQASAHERVEIPGLRPLRRVSAADRTAEIWKAAAEAGRRVVHDPSVDLVAEIAVLSKTASLVIDKETVDAVLSLGFMNPENMSIYADFIPELEKVSSKLAEVLIASRLGMDDVREAAAKNALSQVSSVIRGLTTLRSRIS